MTWPLDASLERMGTQLHTSSHWGRQTLGVEWMVHSFTNKNPNESPQKSFYNKRINLFLLIKWITSNLKKPPRWLNSIFLVLSLLHWQAGSLSLASPRKPSSYIPWPISIISVTFVHMLERIKRSIPQETLCKVRLPSNTKINIKSTKFGLPWWSSA